MSAGNMPPSPAPVLPYLMYFSYKNAANHPVCINGLSRNGRRASLFSQKGYVSWKDFITVESRGDICLRSIYVFEFCLILERRLGRLLVYRVEILSRIEVSRS